MGLLTSWWRDILNIWDELNVMRICGCSEWKYLGYICAMNGATVKMVVLKSFEEKGLFAKFQLSQSSRLCFFKFKFIDKYHVCKEGKEE